MKQKANHPKADLILAFVRNYIAKRGYAPSMREISAALGGASVSNVTHHLNALERNGFLSRQQKVSRSIVLTKKGQRTS